MNKPLWQPSSARIEGANISRFARELSDQGVGEFGDYPSLYAWSIEQPQAFWRAFWDFAEVRAASRGERTLVLSLIHI